MGFISRHPDAPYTDEVVDGTSDLEPDIGNLYNEFNGRVTNLNISATAAIAGSKFLDASIPGSKLAMATLTTSQLTDASDRATDATGDSMTSSLTLVDVPSVAAISVTPSSLTDVLLIEFMATYVSGGAVRDKFGWTFSIGGVDLGVLAISQPVDVGGFASVSYHWAQTAGTTSAIEIKPRYKDVLAGAGTFATTTPATMEANKHFTVVMFSGD